MYCHFSVILSCKITMSQEITLFLTVETWTLIWSIILIFLGQGGGLGAVDPIRPELQKLIRVSLLKSKLCIRRIVLRNCHKQLRPHIRQVKCCYFIEKLCNQMWWIPNSVRKGLALPWEQAHLEESDVAPKPKWVGFSIQVTSPSLDYVF